MNVVIGVYCYRWRTMASRETTLFYQYIYNIGNWRADAQDGCYLDKMPIMITNVRAGGSEKHKVHYNPRTVPKPTEELQRLIFPFIDKYKISFNDLDESYPRVTSCDFLDFMERRRTLLLQNAA